MTESSELNSKMRNLNIDADNCEAHSKDNKNEYSEKEYVDEEPRNVILGMLSQLKKGMDLHKVAFPTFVLEPRSMLERITDFVSHPHLIIEYYYFNVDMLTYILVLRKNLKLLIDFWTL